METQIILKMYYDKDFGHMHWGWELLVDGEVFADGIEYTRADALHKAVLCRTEREEMLKGNVF